MNVKIQSVKFDADSKLIDFIQEKLNKLERFVDNAISADVTLKLDRNEEHGNKVTTIIVDIPGHNLFAERNGKNFEESVDLCVDALRSQIEKRKG